ncbi:hypothetical protein ACHAXA_008216 [Cyclostephanos tholiformis]|uniref:Uncharacterized protein n=1 Tax=Cyclostephanos tholiformis TaxID=382380 RepID=A0ABD3SCE3_9STRA
MRHLDRILHYVERGVVVGVPRSATGGRGAIDNGGDEKLSIVAGGTQRNDLNRTCREPFRLGTATAKTTKTKTDLFRKRHDNDVVGRKFLAINARRRRRRPHASSSSSGVVMARANMARLGRRWSIGLVHVCRAIEMRLVRALDKARRLVLPMMEGSFRVGVRRGVGAGMTTSHSMNDETTMAGRYDAHSTKNVTWADKINVVVNDSGAESTESRRRDRIAPVHKMTPPNEDAFFPRGISSPSSWMLPRRTTNRACSRAMDFIRYRILDKRRG